ncbi:MAG: tRNA uridine-5-carboxymethylaminomethyl(34) synthesis enzyme MnmG [Vampirovibrionales bacterium]|nr:tRNA uridine-5-carboxymethylaminomethyl(34) synthesis enzyme MnmG [Vampirovibrionales bacterium]
MRSHDTGCDVHADVIVIGGGHAGIEAAVAAARLGCNTLLMTMNLDVIGQMSCNPAIGGPAKSQLTREIDALGGVMGECADASYLQMKTLNRSKGPAVWALRAQSDKAEYRRVARRVVEAEPNLRLRQAMAVEILQDSRTRAILGVRDQLGIAYHAPALVITAGTFLNGKLWVGETCVGGGRPGESAATGLTGCLTALGLRSGRLKTGTPPRLDGRTIDYAGLEVHPGDETLRFFSFLPDRPHRAQLPCHLTRTNADTHRLIRENLHRSPMVAGLIDSCGPRYCPSIEDKVVRFADKDSHHLFIEPEGRDTYEVYLQGFSTCLPYEIQVAMARTLPGLSRVHILRPAAAVEYDYFPACQLTPALMAKDAPGLFLAGQINGTSGYEEAAAQGLLAGINAARFAGGQESLILSRGSSYIGSLIDDLVTREILEPYRMLTSRSEYRLLLRQDNADLRLTPLSRDIGLASSLRWEVFTARRERLEAERRRLETTLLAPDDHQRASDRLAEACGERFSEKTTLAQLLKRPAVTLAHLAALDAGCAALCDEYPDVAETLETEIRYSGYIERQQVEIRRLENAGRVAIPDDLDYATIAQLSNEARDKLGRLRPVDLAQAARITGVTPADISVLQIILAKRAQLLAAKP